MAITEAIHAHDAFGVPDRFRGFAGSLAMGFTQTARRRADGFSFSHTPDGISLLGDSAVFTGDALFAGSIGRTDFVGGSYQELMRSIKTKLMSLPDSFKVYCGHGPSTSIGDEKRYNPFLQK